MNKERNAIKFIYNPMKIMMNITNVFTILISNKVFSNYKLRERQQIIHMIQWLNIGHFGHKVVLIKFKRKIKF